MDKPKPRAGGVRVELCLSFDAILEQRRYNPDPVKVGLQLRPRCHTVSLVRFGLEVKFKKKETFGLTSPQSVGYDGYIPTSTTNKEKKS